MNKNILIACSLAILGAAGAYVYVRSNQSTPPSGASTDPEFCVEHQIAEAQCPWCDPSLIESMGQCGAHGVPEALCSRCNETLIAGFKAENDWCGGHGVPESQCVLCQGGEFASGENPH